jgi:hypothetical protein
MLPLFGCGTQNVPSGATSNAKGYKYPMLTGSSGSGMMPSNLPSRPNLTISPFTVLPEKKSVHSVTQMVLPGPSSTSEMTPLSNSGFKMVWARSPVVVYLRTLPPKRLKLRTLVNASPGCVKALPLPKTAPRSGVGTVESSVMKLLSRLWAVARVSLAEPPCSSSSAAAFRTTSTV